VCRSKHFEPSVNFGIINSITKLRLVGISTESSTMHGSMNIKSPVRPRRLPSESFTTQHFTNHPSIDIIQSGMLTATLNKPCRMHPLQFRIYHWLLHSFVTDTNTKITTPQLPRLIGLGIVMHRTRFEVSTAILRLSSDTV